VLKELENKYNLQTTKIAHKKRRKHETNGTNFPKKKRVTRSDFKNRKQVSFPDQ
jgi:hypothetical protein